MTHLLPLNRNHAEFHSEMSEIFANISDQALSDSKVSDLLTKLAWRERSISITKSMVTTAISCVAITYFSKTIALIGCIAFSTLFYKSYTRRSEKENCRLLFTIQFTKEIEYLFGSNLIKKYLSDLSSYDLSFYNHDDFSVKECLEVLKESSSKKKIEKKYKKISIDLKKITQTLIYFKSEGRRLGSLIEESQLDLLLKDLTPFINDVDKNSSNLKEIQEILHSLEDSHFKMGLLDLNSRILADQENLSEKLNALQKNKTLLNKIADFSLEMNQNSLTTTRACQDCILYSLASAILIKTGLFFNKQFNKVNGADREIMNVIAHPFAIGFLGIASIAYAAKKAGVFIAQKKEKAETQKMLKIFTGDDIKRLRLLLQQA